MESPVTIRQAGSETDIVEVRRIFREYEAWHGFDLCFQGYEDELKNLPGKYSDPDGRLYLARVDGAIAGCIALRPLETGVCEMKRLFVKKEFRGLRIGRMLIERVIDDAREIGYATMRLDTFPPIMGKAVELYESYGFREIPPYYNNPNEGVLFMELRLDTSETPIRVR
ncbi:MAG: GNAT family N-acetyltransferase [Acidobacteria bacterium]|nr:MAG: GNAT family N-acetyltransferase [Acidobacteriota bacterium]